MVPTIFREMCKLNQGNVFHNVVVSSVNSFLTIQILHSFNTIFNRIKDLVIGHRDVKSSEKQAELTLAAALLSALSV